MAPVGQQKDKTGKKVRVDEYLRRHFVRLAIPKANKIAPIGEIWLHRSSNGVLHRTDIDIDFAIQLSMSDPNLVFSHIEGVRQAVKIAKLSRKPQPQPQPQAPKASQNKASEQKPTARRSTMSEALSNV